MVQLEQVAGKQAGAKAVGVFEESSVKENNDSGSVFVLNSCRQRHTKKFNM